MRCECFRLVVSSALWMFQADGSFVCPVCAQLYSSLQALEAHHSSDHDCSRHRCDVCEMTFIRESALQEHMKRHNGK